MFGHPASRLTQVQRNQLAEIVLSHGIAVELFEWHASRDILSAKIHGNEYSFGIDETFVGSGTYKAKVVPAVARAFKISDPSRRIPPENGHLSWSDVLDLFNAWVANVAEEVTVADKWETKRGT